MHHNFDVVVIGGTIEGYTSAVHCSRNGFKTLLVELPGYIGGNMEDLKLIHRLKQQALESGLTSLQCEVYSFNPKSFVKTVYTSLGSFTCKGVILAMGLSPKKIGVPLESLLNGCGLHYDHSCSTSYTKNRTIVIYGNNDIAISQAITLSSLSKKVYLIMPDGIIHSTEEKISAAKAITNLIILYNSLIYGLRRHKGRLSGIDIIDMTTGNNSFIDCQLLYVPGAEIPNSKICSPYIFTDKKGFIVTNKNYKTNIDGIYAAGQIRSTILEENPGSCCPKENIMAASDGAIAAMNIMNYIKTL